MITLISCFTETCAVKHRSENEQTHIEKKVQVCHARSCKDFAVRVNRGSITFVSSSDQSRVNFLDHLFLTLKYILKARKAYVASLPIILSSD